MFPCTECNGTALSFMRGKHNFHIVRTAPNERLQSLVSLPACVSVAYMSLKQLQEQAAAQFSSMHTRMQQRKQV